jgi:hypothetical protein
MRRRRRELILGIVAGACVYLALSTSATAAQPPYEPNDSLLTAHGPLGVNQTYEAAIETENDRDYFYFYVTAAAGAQVRLTLKDTGGRGEYLVLRLEDSHGSSVSSIETESGAGDTESLNVSLGPGKYFVDVSGGEGISYSLATAGTEGAFGEFGPILAQCQGAAAYAASVAGAVEVLKARLGSDEGRLRKARAHLKRALRHRNRRAKKKARRTVAKVNEATHQAKEAVRAEERVYKAAVATEQPWCSIPQ